MSFRNFLMLLGVFLVIGACSHGKGPKRDLGGQTDGIHTSGLDLSATDLEEDPWKPEWLPRNPWTQAQVSFDWPVDEARLTRGWFVVSGSSQKGSRRWRRAHWGLDLANKKGTPIYAAHDGRVIHAGGGFRGYGRLVIVESAHQDLASLYAHLWRIAVRKGDWVKKGQVIGYMGKTGRARGYHLHFEIRTLAGPQDPLVFLPPVDPQKHPWVGRRYVNKLAIESQIPHNSRHGQSLPE